MCAPVGAVPTEPACLLLPWCYDLRNNTNHFPGLVHSKCVLNVPEQGGDDWQRVEVCTAAKKVLEMQRCLPSGFSVVQTDPVFLP